MPNVNIKSLTHGRVHNTWALTCTIYCIFRRNLEPHAMEKRMSSDELNSAWKIENGKAHTHFFL